MGSASKARKGVEVITRKIVRPLPDQDRDQQALDTLLANADKMSVDAYVASAFAHPKVERIGVFRVLPDGREANVGFLPRDLLESVESFEEHLLSKFGGPGTWILKPARGSTIGRGFTYYGRWKRVMLGVSAEADAGVMRGTLEDVERLIVKDTQMTAAMAWRKRLEDETTQRARGGEEGVKAEDFKMIAEALATARGANGGASEAVMQRLLDRLDSLEKKVDRPAWESLITSLTPLLTPLLATIKPGTLEKYAAIVKGWQAAPVIAAPERPWWEGITALFKEALASPALQPLMVKLMEGIPTRPTVVAAPSVALPARSEEVKSPMATRTFTDPDTLDALTAVVGYLGERKFAEAWAVMRQVPDLIPWVAQIEPGVEPMAYWFGLKSLDARLLEMKATCLEFIEYMQETIARAEAEIAARQGTATKGSDDGGTTPS